MKKDWIVTLYDFNEDVMKSVKYRQETREVANEHAKACALHYKAHTYSLEEYNPRWIKSKIAVVLGYNNMFIGMCVVNNEEELKEVQEAFPFPYLVAITDDIWTKEEFMEKTKIIREKNKNDLEIKN
jgi:hypothetical protein